MTSFNCIWYKSLSDQKLIIWLIYISFFYRKKLRQELGRQYPLIDEDELTEIIPTKEEMLTMKIYTHSGQTAQVYVLQRNPIFFEVETTIYPTGRYHTAVQGQVLIDVLPQSVQWKMQYHVILDRVITTLNWKLNASHVKPPNIFLNFRNINIVTTMIDHKWCNCISMFYSLWPSDAIWHRFRSTLDQVMTGCLMAPSH